MSSSNRLRVRRVRRVCVHARVCVLVLTRERAYACVFLCVRVFVDARACVCACTGMLGRLLEDCPEGWDAALDPPALDALAARAGAPHVPPRRAQASPAMPCRTLRRRLRLRGNC